MSYIIIWWSCPDLHMAIEQLSVGDSRLDCLLVVSTAAVLLQV